MARRYRNPPLIEAACDFRFDLGAPWDLAIPGLLYEKLRGDFPTRNPLKEFESTIKAGSEGIEQQIVQADRIQFLSENKAAIVQVSQNILAINHLRPYPTWDKYLPVIRQALSAFREVANPKGIARVTLRYINRLVLPARTVKLEDYLEFYPFVGERLPQEFGQFVVGIKVPFENDRDVLQLSLGGPSPEKDGAMFVTLDLHYIRAKSQDVDFHNVFEWLQTAHTHIEAVFEGCITEKLRTTFDEVHG